MQEEEKEEEVMGTRKFLWFAAGAAALSLALPAGASAGTCATQTNANNVDIVEGPPTTSLVTTIGGGGPATDVDVHLDIVHPNPEQLAVFVQHATLPISPPIELTSGNGAGGENYSGTILDDEAVNPITGAAAPFTGRYRPETPLTAFDGQSDSGAWTLSISDTNDPGDPDTGYIDSWGVTTSSDACTGPSPGDGGDGGGGGGGTNPGATTPAPKTCKKGQKLKQGKCVKKKRKKKK